MVRTPCASGSPSPMRSVTSSQSGVGATRRAIRDRDGVGDARCALGITAPAGFAASAQANAASGERAPSWLTGVRSPRACCGQRTWRVAPSSSWMRSSRLYLQTRSVRHSDPVLICPQPLPTARSAMVVSSVSPERCDVDRRVARVARDADRLERLRERSDLIELDQDGVARRACRCPRAGSPGSSRRDRLPRAAYAAPSLRVSEAQPSQSSSARPSSIDTTG